MKISYDFTSPTSNLTISDKEDVENLNVLLSNNKGDFLNLGLIKNTTKFQGLNVYDSKTNKVFKVLDEITQFSHTPISCKYFGSSFSRELKSNLVNNEIAKDKFYLGPSGGMIYELENFNGEIFLDFDCREKNDFHEWGRIYSKYVKSGILFVKYQKIVEEKEKYSLLVGFKISNLSYEYLENNWVEKTYSYSKKRNSKDSLYLFRGLKLKIDGDLRLVCGVGFSEEEISAQINLLDKHQKELQEHDNSLSQELAKVREYETPLTQDMKTALSLSKHSLYKFLNKELNSSKIKQGSYAGFPWFPEVWARDELASLKSLIINKEYIIVKERINHYLKSVDVNTGMIKRIESNGSLESVDSILWLAKRIEDFIFHLDNKNMLFKILSKEEIENYYKRLTFSFHKIIKNSWDKDMELIKVNYGDSWMDTIELKFPLDIQVQLLEFISTLGVLADLVERKEEAQRFIDLEAHLRDNIRVKFVNSDFTLSNEPGNKKVTVNTFLAYYFYKDLFTKEDWENIFDETLKHLKTPWGGLRSLSKKDPEYQDNYTGEDNKSYHKGDSWFWMNNIAAIALQDVNDKKYRKVIFDIIHSSTNDILKKGCIGFGSEVSSASKQKPEGCFAQLWTSATYFEMIDKIFR